MPNRSSSSRNTPKPIKRILRQEAGFGCCICGYPFIEYHHIVPYAEDRHYRSEDMMVLCSRHHDLCTANAIDEDEQRERKRNPFNMERGLSEGCLYTSGESLAVKFGDAVLYDVPSLLAVAGKTIVGIRRSSSGKIEISAILQNKDGEICGRIHHNEWIIRNNTVWDVEASPKIAKLRSELNRIDFCVDARKELTEIRGKWFIRGMGLEFNPSSIKLGGSTIRGMRGGMAEVFIDLG